MCSNGATAAPTTTASTTPIGPVSPADYQTNAIPNRGSHTEVVHGSGTTYPSFPGEQEIALHGTASGIEQVVSTAQHKSAMAKPRDDFVH